MGIICENCEYKIWSESYNPMWMNTTCPRCGALISCNFNEYDYHQKKRALFVDKIMAIVDSNGNSIRLSCANEIVDLMFAEIDRVK